MYAIIRTGGKQSKVQEGDVLDVERLRAEGEVTFTPLLVVHDDGTVISGRDNLAEVKVVAKVLGPSAGPKIDIFKYKSKTGYRRRQGHRQKYTQIEVTAIEVPGKKKPAKKKAPAKKASAEAEVTEDIQEDAAPAAKKAPAKKAPAKKAPAATSDDSTDDASEEPPADDTAKET